MGNGVRIRGRENCAPYFLLAAGSRRMWVSCKAVCQNCYQIGSWLIYFFFFPLLERIFFFFTALFPLAKKKGEEENFCFFFFFQQDNSFGVSRSKMVYHMTKWTFIQCAFLPFLPGQVEGVFTCHWATLAFSCHWELLLSIKTWYCCGTSLFPAILSRIMGYRDK